MRSSSSSRRATRTSGASARSAPAGRLKSDVAITTRKGSGLVDALTIATNGLIANGKFRASLARWSLEEEALDRSETNPPGLPKY